MRTIDCVISSLGLFKHFAFQSNPFHVPGGHAHDTFLVITINRFHCKLQLRFEILQYTLCNISILRLTFVVLTLHNSPDTIGYFTTKKQITVLIKSPSSSDTKAHSRFTRAKFNFPLSHWSHFLTMLT